jgi:UDP-N-acetyl-2-amino-2-deoxyglucuronate dehydrogenase
MEIRLGIIGAGAVAGHHARAAVQTEGVTLAGIASRNREKAESLATHCNTRTYRDAEELLDDPKIDLVVICTYPDTHGLYAIQAARRGKHVLVEKPFDITLAGADRTIEECGKAGVTLAVVSQKRFCDGPRFLNQAVQSGALGKILQADAYMKWYREPSYYARSGKGAWEVEGGGALINQAIHQIDLLRWIAGPVRKIYCEWQLGGLHPIESEDAASALLRYSSGAIGVVQAATCFYPGFPDRLEIHGTAGSVATEGDYLKRWDVEGTLAPSPELFQSGGLGASKPMDIPVTPFCRQLLDVKDAILSRREPLVSGEEGRETLRLVLEMYRSAREGREVELS